MITAQNSQVLYNGTGSEVNFAITFPFIENSHIVCYVVDLAGTRTLQVLTTNYTLAGAGDAGGGTLTFVVAPLATDTIEIYRVVPFSQLYQYSAGGDFSSTGHENAVDLTVMLCQSIRDGSHLGAPGDRALKVVMFDANGIPSLVNVPLNYEGAGSPEGVVTANRGSIYIDTVTGAFYWKSTSGVNTGWKP